MKYLLQFAIILLITFAGEILHAVIPLPVPASIYGIAILFLLLETKLLRVEQIREAGKYLVEIMSVMFIPAAVGLMEHWDILIPSAGKYLAVILISTVLVMGIAGSVTQLVIRKGNKHD